MAEGEGNPYGDGNGAGGAGAQGGDGNGAGGAGAQGGDGNGAGGYTPENFPDHLRGENDQETIDKLFGAYSGARDELGKRGKVPKKPEDYELAFSDELKGTFGDPDADEGVKIFRNVAHKHGLTSEQAKGFFEDFHQSFMEAGLVDTIDPKAEAKKMAGDDASRMSDQEVTAKAQARWQDGVNYIDSLNRSGSLSDDQAVLAKALLETADGVMMIEAFKSQSRESALQPGGDGGASGSITEADLHARVRDPRNDPFNSKHDPAYTAETDRLFKSFYDGKAA